MTELEIYNALEKSFSELQKYKKQAEAMLKNVPSGNQHLRVSRRGKSFEYYLIEKTGATNGNYLKKANQILLKQLCRKEYAQKVLRTIEKQSRSISKFLEKFRPAALMQVYTDLHPGKQEFVHPIIPDDETYVKEWNAVAYFGRSFDESAAEFFTQKGERVRSKSEILIADSLAKNNVPYHYEFPVKVGHRTVYPDFYCLNVRTREMLLWEHLGMMDNPDYVQKAVLKLNEYQNAGYVLGKNLIITMESIESPLNVKTVRQMIAAYLK